MQTIAKRPPSKSGIIESLKERIAEKGFRGVPLRDRVHYDFFDDHERNHGDIGWVVITDSGDLCGLDFDMEIGLDRFRLGDLLSIEPLLDWDGATSTPRESE